MSSGDAIPSFVEVQAFAKERNIPLIYLNRPPDLHSIPEVILWYDDMTSSSAELLAMANRMIVRQPGKLAAALVKSINPWIKTEAFFEVLMFSMFAYTEEAKEYMIKMLHLDENDAVLKDSTDKESDLIRRKYLIYVAVCHLTDGWNKHLRANTQTA